MIRRYALADDTNRVAWEFRYLTRWAADRDCARWNARVGQADAWRVVRVGRWTA